MKHFMECLGLSDIENISLYHDLSIYGDDADEISGFIKGLFMRKNKNIND